MAATNERDVDWVLITPNPSLDHQLAEVVVQWKYYPGHKLDGQALDSGWAVFGPGKEPKLQLYHGHDWAQPMAMGRY